LGRRVLFKSGRQVDLGANRENLIQIAQEVAIERGAQVVESLFAMGAIRSLHAGPAARHATITCEKARVQSYGAKRGQQAAHLLPGQILVDGIPVWELARSRSPELSREVEVLKLRTQMCFADMRVLPALFNRADTEAEGTGKDGAAAAERLKPLYGSVVQAMWRSVEVHPEAPLVVDRKGVQQALGGWFERVRQVYHEAADRKAARGRIEEACVLTTYADSFHVGGVARFIEWKLPYLRSRHRFLS